MMHPSAEKPFKILVITSPKGIRHIQQKLLREKNIAVTLANLHDLSALLDGKNIEMFVKNKLLKDFDYVWIQSAGMTRDIAYMLSLYLDSVNIPHTNPEVEMTKIVDLFVLTLHGVPIPKTYFRSKSKLLSELPYLVEELEYPFLVKATIGWGGNDVHIIHNAAEFFSKVPDLAENKKYTCQKFIPNTFDYRVIVGNGKVLSGEKRIRVNDLYRNNASLGAEEVFLDLKDIPESVQKIAIDAANAFGLSWAGIDIITHTHTGKHYVLEVNRRPGLTEKSTETVAAMTFLTGFKREP
jgi:glutathione synthase/RimK-type ligase-like ATP-grasp enzyme